MNKPILTGAKGGGGQRTPVISPDTLLADDVVEFILGLQEGPIAGLVQGPKSFYLNDTPLVSASGSNNFNPFELHLFHGGDPASEILPALGGTASNEVVSTTLAQNTPVIRTTNPAQKGLTDRLEVRLRFNALFNSTDNGDQMEHTAVFKIHYRAVGDTEWIPFYDANPNGVITLTGKTTSGYPKDFVKAVPRVDKNYEIRVEKLSPDNTPRQVVDIGWESFQTINTDKPRYDNLAVIRGLGRASDQFSSIPTFWGVYALRVVKVPSNYDPITRHYDGVWDGTFKDAHTDNPAWCAYDLLTNESYGVKRYYPFLQADRYAFYEAAKICDQLVPIPGSNPQTYQPRWTYNDLIDQPRNALELLAQIVAIFGGLLVGSLNGFVSLKLDRPGPIQMIFGPESADISGFAYQFTDITQRVNDVTVQFKNPHLNWEVDVRNVVDEVAVAANGRISEDGMVALGCTNVHEAQRRAQRKIIQANTEKMLVTFSVPRVGINLEEFDLIGISDPSMDWGLSGRVKSVIGTTIQLRDPLHVPADTDMTLSVQTRSGVQDLTVRSAGIYTTTLEIQSGTWPSDAPEKAQFALTLDGALGLVKPFRVVTITEDSENPDRFVIIALEHNVNKYGDVDNMQSSGVVDYSYKYEPNKTPPVIEVVESGGQHALLNSDGSTQHRIYLRWSIAPTSLVRNFRIKYRQENREAWQSIQVNTQEGYIPNVVVGVPYEIVIQALDIKGQPVGPTAATVYTPEKDIEPPEVPGPVTATPTIRGMNLTWPRVSAIDLRQYEIFYTTDGQFVPDENTVPTDQTASNVYPITTLNPDLEYHFWVRAVDLNWNYSDWSTKVSATPEAVTADDVNIPDDSVEWTQLTQDVRDQISSAGDADAAATAAELAQGEAEDARDAAAGYRDDAFAAKALAELYRNDASGFRDGALEERNLAVSAKTAALKAAGILQPAQVGAPSELWSHEWRDPTYAFPRPSVDPNSVTSTPELGECISLAGPDNTATLAHAQPTPFDRGRAYLVKAQVQCIDDGTSGQGATAVISYATHKNNGTVLLETAFLAGNAVPVTVADGVVEIDLLIYPDTVAATPTLPGVTNYASHGSASDDATSISISVRQNTGGSPDGDLVVGLLDIRDVTEAVLADQSLQASINTYDAVVVARDDAEDFASAASGYALTADTAKSGAEAARDAAVVARNEGEGFASAAEGSALSASTDAATATSKAAEAVVAAGDADGYAAAAQQERIDAATAASAAVAEKDLTVAARNQAEGYASDALIYAGAAETSRLAAGDSETAAILATAAAQPSKVGPPLDLWNFGGITGTGERPLAKITPSLMDTTAGLGDCFVFPNSNNDVFGTAFEIPFKSNSFYLITARIEVFDDGSPGSGELAGCNYRIGFNTFSNKGLTSHQRNVQTPIDPIGITEADGVQEVVVLVHPEGMEDEIGDFQDFDHKLEHTSLSNGATFLAAHVRQNISHPFVGRLAVGNLEVKDITDAMLASRSALASVEAADVAAAWRQDASDFATAAQQAKVDAETAFGQAEAEKNLAATARQGAEDAEAAALGHTEVASQVEARVVHQGVLDDPGFEWGIDGQSSIPAGWIGDAMQPAAFGDGRLAYRETASPNSPFGSKMSFGAATNNTGPWWWIGKRFKCSPGQTFYPSIWVSMQNPSSHAVITAGNGGLIVGEDDVYVHELWYDADGQLLSEGTRNGANFTICQDLGGDMTSNEFYYFENGNKPTAPANAAFFELRYVCADMNATEVSDKTDYSNLSGGAPSVKLDDFNITTDGVLQEISAAEWETNGYRVSAGVSESLATAAKGDAEDAAAAAAFSREVAAKVAGGELFNNATFQDWDNATPEGVTIYTGSATDGEFEKLTTGRYGNALRLNTFNTTTAWRPLVIISGTDSYNDFPPAEDCYGVSIVMELERLGGAWGGARLEVRWIAGGTGGTNASVYTYFKDHLAGAKHNIIHTLEYDFIRPDDYVPGSSEGHIEIRIYGTTDDDGNAFGAQNWVIHRISPRSLSAISSSVITQESIAAFKGLQRSLIGFRVQSGTENQAIAELELVSGMDPETGVARSDIRMSADNLLLEGSVGVDLMTIKKYLDIDAKNAGFRMGKRGIGDFNNDGIYLGRTNEVGGTTGFGLFAGRTEADQDQYVRLSKDHGFVAKNLDFLIGAAVPDSPVEVLSSQTVNLPSLKDILNLTIQGGGGGRATDSDGGDTIVVLKDGSTTIETWTAPGGQAGVGPETSNWSPFLGQFPGRGDARIGQDYKAPGISCYQEHDSLICDPFPEVPGIAGGEPGEFITVTNYDISGLSNPKLEITIGASGWVDSRGLGAVEYTTQEGQDFVAAPVSLAPIRGTFVMTAGVAGSFPNVPPWRGLWLVQNLPSGWQIHQGDGSTLLEQLAFQTNLTFVSAALPTYTSNHSETRTVTYTYHPM